MDDRDARFARIAFQLGLLTSEQVEEAAQVAESTQPSKPIGQVFIERGILTLDQVFDVLRLLDGDGRLAARHAPQTGGVTLSALVGRHFARYSILEEIGRGAMGVVFKARDEELGRIVAVKILGDAHAANPSALKRFQREAQTASKLRHPAIVAIHDVGTHDGAHYFTMDFIEGTSLDKLLPHGTIGVLQGVEILEEVARAVHHAHQHGVVHRDLKPGNIMLDGAMKPFVMDFGLARSLEDDSVMTHSGQAVGTPLYMSPEQVRGNSRLTGPVSDVYSLGVILYQILTGQNPFAGPSVMEVYQKILQGRPAPPRSVKSGIPPDLEVVCMKAMAAEPHRRYPSAEAFADDLGRFRRGEPILARPPSTAERLGRGLRRWSPLLAAAALVAAASAVVAGWPVSPSAPYDAEGFVRRGEQRQQDKDFRGALEDFSTALRMNPDLRAAFFHRAEAHQALGDEDAMSADLEKALQGRTYDPELDRHFVEACLMLGDYHLARGRFEAAIKHYSRALESSPHQLEAMAKRGRCNAELKRYRECAADLEAVIRRNPNAPEEVRNLLEEARRHELTTSRHYLDYTGGAQLANVGVKLSKILPNYLPNSENSIVLEEISRSAVEASFELSEKPEEAVLELEHASAADPAFRNGGATIVSITINGSFAAQNWDVGHHGFHVARLAVGKFLQRGRNAIEIRLVGGETPYWLRRLEVQCAYPAGPK